MVSTSMTSSTAIEPCLDILRRTNPRELEKASSGQWSFQIYVPCRCLSSCGKLTSQFAITQHLASLSSLVSDDDANHLRKLVQVPLAVGKDSEAGGRQVSERDVFSTPDAIFVSLDIPQFLLCAANRDGNSHRSPWSNAFVPPREDGIRPSERLRSLEIHANEVFNVYRELYYDKATSVSSVYLWDHGGDGTEGRVAEGKSLGFSGCFLVQNRLDDDNYWNSVHVVDVGPVHKGECTYKLTSTLLLSITTPLPPVGTEHADSTISMNDPDESTTKTNISGSLTRHNVRQLRASNNDTSHIVNMGQFIEDTESDLRSEMDSLYIQKTKTIVEDVRKECTGEKTQEKEHACVLNEAVLAMALNRKCAT